VPIPPGEKPAYLRDEQESVPGFRAPSAIRRAPEPRLDIQSYRDGSRPPDHEPPMESVDDREQSYSDSTPEIVCDGCDRPVSTSHQELACRALLTAGRSVLHSLVCDVAAAHRGSTCVLIVLPTLIARLNMRILGATL
jgi:hypothetical protein